MNLRSFHQNRCTEYPLCQVPQRCLYNPGYHSQKYGYWKDNGIRLIGDAVTNFTLMFLKTYDIYSNNKTNYKDYISEKNNIKTNGFIQPFGDGPAPIYDNYVSENVYLNIINQATKYIYITTPYLIVDHNLMNALENAAKRGVDVRIITPGVPDKKLIFTEGCIEKWKYKTPVKNAETYAHDIIGNINKLTVPTFTSPYKII